MPMSPPLLADGGHWHLSRSFRNSPEEDFIELSETEEVDDEELFKNS